MTNKSRRIGIGTLDQNQIQNWNLNASKLLKLISFGQEPDIRKIESMIDKIIKQRIEDEQQ